MGGRSVRPMRGLVVLVITVALVASLAGTASAATLIGNFKLKGNFRNSAATPLRLAGVGDVAFATTDVDGKSRRALLFDAGEGLRLRKVSTNARANYSISIWFELDHVTGFRRLMSFGPNDIEMGLYVSEGGTALYDVAENDTTVFAPDTWVKVHVTRDASTNRVKVFVDGTEVISYKDYREVFRLFLGQAVLFRDDNGEQSAGTIAAVKVWRGAKAP